MSDLFKKLQYKGSNPLLILNAPETFQPHLHEIGSTAQIDTQLTDDKRYDFALIFVKAFAEVQALAAPVVNQMQEDGILWFAYPKKSSKRYKTDLGRDESWQPVGELGYEGVRMVAIDADWSALRVRHVSKIKSMTRNERGAMSPEGKARVSQPKDEL